jgi:hypothetical protein
MGAQSIISPKPNTQNDKKPFPSTFLRKSEELPASIILLYGSDAGKNSRRPLFCQQLILLFSTGPVTSRLTEMAMLETMSKDVQNWLWVLDVKKDAIDSQRCCRPSEHFRKNRISLG